MAITVMDHSREFRFSNYVVQDASGEVIRHWHKEQPEECSWCKIGVPLELDEYPVIRTDDQQVRLWTDAPNTPSI